MINHAIDALEMERDLLREKAGVKRAELRYYHKETTQDVKDMERRAAECDRAIKFLYKHEKAISIKPGPAGGNGDGTRGNPKHLAKCGERSYFYCKTCEQRKARTCNLVRYRSK